MTIVECLVNKSSLALSLQLHDKFDKQAFGEDAEAGALRYFAEDPGDMEMRQQTTECELTAA
jgi:hypothetical protein